MDLTTVLIVISSILGIVTVVATGAWGKVLTKLRDAKALLSAAAELITALVAALEDSNISKEEVAILKAKWEGLKLAFKKLFGKEIEEVV